MTAIRKSDPFEVRPDPAGLSYQWVDAYGSTYDEMKKGGWICVPAAWHPNESVFIKDMILVCRPKGMTDKAHDDNLAKVGKQMDDWAKRFGGFAGGVRVSVQTSTDDPKVPTWAFTRSVGNDPQLEERIAAAQYQTTAKKMNRLAFGSLPDVPLVAPTRRIPRYRLLAWLFNLISVEDKT